MTRGRIIYSRGFPYGAPLAMVRGGATRDPEVKAVLRERGFTWDGMRHAWTHYLYHDRFAEVLGVLRDMGCEVIPKADLDPGYLIDLDAVPVQEPLAVATESREALWRRFEGD